jgi:hypothetical protein
MAKMWLNTDKTKGTSHTFAFVLVGFANVRFGSNAEVMLTHRNVRFTPESRHFMAALGCLLCAKSRHGGALVLHQNQTYSTRRTTMIPCVTSSISRGISRHGTAKDRLVASSTETRPDGIICCISNP